MSAPQPGTPLPWQYHDDYTTEGFVTIIGNVDGEYVDGQAHCTYDVVCRCEDEFGERLPDVAKNVRYIVHAANNFPKAQALADALRALRDFGCPVCSGDCGSANPPVTNCPMAAASAALTDWEGK